jgi:predicted ATPase
VLTGGPGAGKTAVLELVSLTFCEHVRVLPEAAGVVYRGGFPRVPDTDVRRAAQRAIFYVERELERAGASGNPALVLCDRGTIDGAAYWPGPGDMWVELGTTLADQLSRYEAVVHLRVPPAGSGYDQRNPLRVETAAEAEAIDERIAVLWSAHPRQVIVDPSPDFLSKAARALAQLRDVVPECCRPRVVPLVDPSLTAATT